MCFIPFDDNIAWVGCPWYSDMMLDLLYVSVDKAD